MEGTNRKYLRPGMDVDIVLKRDQNSGKLTRGVIKDILTKSLGSANRINVARATMLALSQLKDPAAERARRKAIEVEETKGG